jgi:2-pyrone-4,6-dicarboxylate lactonase
MPVPPPPQGSCDCQFHIYGDPAKYPPGAAATYPPIDASFEDAVAMHRGLGFERGVIVHSSVYGSDHRLLLDTLENLDLATRKRYRATSIIDDSVSDKELERLNAAGVCAARLNIAKMFGVTPTKSAAQRTIDRIREFGWHVRLHVRGNDLLEFSDVLKSVEGINMVIDHMGHVDLSKGVDQPVCRWILDMLRRDNWWMMVSNGNRDSSMEAGWDDAVPVGRAYVAAAPERIIWATDWPHPMWSKRMMNDAEEVELLYRYVDNDRALLQKILVDNPVRLHGFEP